MEVLREISFAWCLLNTLVVFMCLYESRFSRKKNIILSVAFMVPLIVLNIILFIYRNEALIQNILITCSVPSLIFFLFMAKRRDGRFLFTFCFADTITAGIIIFTALLEHWFGKGQCIVLFGSRIIIYLVLEVVIWKFLRKPYLDVRNNIEKGWGVFALVSVIYYVLIFVAGAYPTNIVERPDDIMTVVLIIVAMLLTYLAIFRVLSSQMKLYEAEKEKIYLDKQKELMEDELAVGRDYIMLTKQVRHDMRHSLNIISNYLDNNDVTGAKAYLSEYITSIGTNSLVSFCENEIMNAILRMYGRRCENDNIDYKVNVVVPKKLPYTKIETGVIFGNIMENAWEAARKCDRAILYVDAAFRNNTLTVEIHNSVLGKVVMNGEIPESTKPGGGIGVGSALSVLEKYGGMMRMHQEKNVFVTQLIQKL